MRSLVIVLLLLTAALGPAARAQDGEDTGTIVYGVIPNCSGRAVIDVTVEAIAASVEAYRGKCVRLRGIWSGRRLFSDLETYWKTPQMLGGDEGEPTAARHIGVYSLDVRFRLPTGLSRAEIVGIVGDCDELARGAIMVMGFCHYERGSWVAIDTVRTRPLRPTRLTSDADRLVLGRLVAAPADMAERPAALALTRRWLAAVKAGDRETLQRLYWQEEPERDPDYDQVRQIFRSQPGLYRDRRLFRPGAQIEVFVGKRPGAAGPDRTDEGWQWGLISCVCKTDDCSGRWPIFPEDATNRIDRPYVCLAVDQMNEPSDPLAYRIETYAEDRGLREPPPPPR